MVASSAYSVASSLLPAPPSALLGASPSPQLAAGSALAVTTALAATASVALPNSGVRGGILLFRTLRQCALLGSSASGTHASGVFARAVPGVTSRAQLSSCFAAKAANTASGAVAGLSPAGLGFRVSSGSGGASGSAVWGHLRRHLQLQRPRQQQQQQHDLRASCSSFTSAAADPAAAAATAAGWSATARRCGGLAGRRGLLEAPTGGRPRPMTVRRMMATEASGAASAAPSSAAAPSGLLARFRGRLLEALRLQLAAVWHKYGTAAYVCAAVAAVLVLWRLMRSVTTAFIAVNDKMAEYGIMAVAASLVLLAVLYLRWRTLANPAAVYRQAMMQLNTSPAVLEVMGAPLVGSPVRAYVITGGGLYLSKSFRVKWRSRRVQMMFPLSGSDRKGLVSLEAKRKGGRYVWKLLAVDLAAELQQALPSGGRTSLSAAPPPRHPPPALAPAASPRVYLVRDSKAVQREGVLDELRAPFLKALNNSRSYEVEDELDDELDELNAPKSSKGGGGAAAVKSAVLKAMAALSTPGAAAAAAADGGAAAPLSPSSETAPESSRAAEASRSLDAAKPSPAAPSSEAPSSEAPGQGSWWSRLRAALSGPPAASSDAK